MIQKKNRKIFQLVLLSAPFMLASCVDSDYDLSKEIDMTVSLNGPGMTIPVGYTDSVKLGSIIDTAASATLILDDDDTYVIEKKDKIETVNIEVTPPSIQPIAPVFDGVQVYFEPSTDIRQNSSYIARVNDVSSFEINEEIDAAIKSLKIVQWDQPVNMTFTLTFDNFPEEAIQQGIYLDNLQISFPEFIQFAPEEGIEKGILNLSGHFDPNSGMPYVRTFKITGMDFSKLPGKPDGLTIENRKLFIDRSLAQIQVSGFISTDPDEVINTDKLHEFSILPTVEIPAMVVDHLVGLFDPDIEERKETAALNLGDDLDFLKNEQTHLDIDNPKFQITLTNTVGAPADISLTMFGTDAQGTTISGSEVTVDLSGDKGLAPADNDTPVTTVFYISRKAITLPPAQDHVVYRNIIQEDLNKLVQRVPDEIQVNMKTRVNQNETHRISLNRDLDITGDYTVSFPLVFDALDIVYSDTIKNLQDDLSDFLDKTKTMELILKGNLYNAIPLPMQLSARAMNASGVALSADNVSVEVYANGSKDGLITAGSQEGQAAVSDIEIHITAAGDELRQLDKIEWQVQVSSEADNNGDITLKSSQYLLFKDLKATVKQITLDLN